MKTTNNTNNNFDTIKPADVMGRNFLNFVTIPKVVLSNFGYSKIRSTMGFRMYIFMKEKDGISLDDPRFNLDESISSDARTIIDEVRDVVKKEILNGDIDEDSKILAIGLSGVAVNGKIETLQVLVTSVDGEFKGTTSGSITPEWVKKAQEEPSKRVVNEDDCDKANNYFNVRLFNSCVDTLAELHDLLNTESK